MDSYLVHEGLSWDQAGKLLLRRFSTGSTYFDAILGFILFTLFMRLSDQMQNIPTNFARIPGWLRSLFQSQPMGTIDFSMEEELFCRETFTPTYRAIMHKISLLPPEKAWKFRERYLNQYCNYEERYLEENIFQVLQEEPIEVEPNIYIQYHLKEEDRAGRQGSTTHITQHKLTVFSYKHTVHELIKIVDGWTKEFQDYKKNELEGKQLIFFVRFGLSESDDDNNGNESQESIEYTEFQTFRSFDNLFLDGKSDVLKEIDFFLHEKEWHAKRGLADSLGILCYGQPGCGKTSFIKALLRHTNRHGVVFSVNRYTKLETIEKLMRNDTICDFPIPQSQRVYILEDIDAMGDLVHKREDPDEDDKKAKQRKAHEKNLLDKNLTRLLKFGLTQSSEQHLGFFLNLLDGLVEAPGRIIVMTTNYIDKLDPALIRPGRIDVKLEFVRCNRNVVHQVFTHFFDGCSKDWVVPEEVEDGLLTPAELTQICRSHKLDFEGAVDTLRLAARQRSLDPKRNLAVLDIQNRVNLNVDAELCETEPEPLKVKEESKCHTNNDAPSLVAATA